MQSPIGPKVYLETGARTCLHVRPGRLTMLECRFNNKEPPKGWSATRNFHNFVNCIDNLNNLELGSDNLILCGLRLCCLQRTRRGVIESILEVRPTRSVSLSCGTGADPTRTEPSSPPRWYSTSPRTRNRVNRNHLEICLSSSQKNRNSLAWILLAVSVCPSAVL
jgi:hypothetical protein